MRNKISNEVYKSILDCGYISIRQKQVFKLVAKFGPITAHEAVETARKNGFKGNQTGINARFSELERLNVIEKSGYKINPKSGKKNTLWKTSNKKPVPQEILLIEALAEARLNVRKAIYKYRELKRKYKDSFK